MSDLYLYVYDLSKGLAKQLSAMFLGKHFDGIWHTGIVAFGQEWYFGNDGISSCPPKGTVLGEPDEIVNLGRTELSYEDFREVISQMSANDYKIGSYNLLKHNCNNFSNDLSLVLVGKPIPSHIIELPGEILNTPFGPILRSFLEQAADPVHQLKTGNSAFPMMNNPLLNNFASTSTVSTPKTTASTTTASKTSPQSSKPISRAPSTALLFKPDKDQILQKYNSFLEFYQSDKNHKLNDYNLLIEVKEFVQQNEIRWTISKNHVQLLVHLYLNFVNDAEHKVTFLKLFQLIVVNQEVAELLMKNEHFATHFFSKTKQLAEPDLQYLSLQFLSNMCRHESVSQYLLQQHEEEIFKELSEFTLTETTNDINVLIHESSISFFYNLISAFHLDKLLTETNALTLGCALLERIPKLKPKPMTVYQMLALLRSCLTRSSDIRELALSMNFDLNQFKSNAAEQSTSSNSSSDSYENVLQNIDELIHEHH